MKIRYTERAKQDLNLGIFWYEQKRKGLGLSFLDCIEAALFSIQRAPQIYRIAYGHFRSCPLKRFPYTVYYTIEVSEVVVHAVFANRMHPDGRP